MSGHEHNSLAYNMYPILVDHVRLLYGAQGGTHDWFARLSIISVEENAVREWAYANLEMAC